MRGTILVTGASGGLASAAIPLLRQSATVIAVGRKMAPGLDAVWDGTEGEMLELLAKFKPSTIVHLAAARPYSAEEKTILSLNVGMARILTSALARAHATPVVFASSRAVYGAGAAEPLLEHRRPAPISPYGVSKLEAEQVFERYGQETGQAVTILRLSQIYGPRTKSSGTIEVFLNLALAGRPLEVFGDLSMKRDFIYIDDAARAVSAAVEACRDGVFNCGSGLGISYLDLAKTISRLFGSPMNIGITDPVGISQQTVLDIRKARAELHWEPQVSLEEGLRRWWAYKEQFHAG